MGNEEGEKEQEQQGDNVEDTLNDDSASSTHAVNNKKGKLLACQLCGKQVYKLPYLEAHIRSVHEGHSKPFLCRGCNKSYTRYEQLRSHMRNVHPNSPLANTSNDPSAQQDQPLEQQRLICELCNRQYSTKNALGEHLKRHAQFKQHVCEHCGVAKVTRTELLTHLQVHNPDWQKFKCEQCPQLFRHKSAITRHVRVVHEGQRRYKCTYCHRRFGTHASQLRHEKLHEGELPHQCKVCGMRFADLDRLTTHMCAHDSNLWPYTCVHCSKSCTTRQNLVIHEQRHASKKPHICNTCSRGFISELLLAQHKQIPCIERCSNVRTTEDTESGTT
ncbi:zinc finger protein 677 isoform X2 [Scaptodrosophila lebanonensis]|nr:zinc finger protein 677 isoform X2 [Scaptodrosophila lebanonensis]XP_030381955.1 zinc finger protein 677 isoform X2 [Scaptodrosophila lebanonensis]